jgi:hypothetical protein
MNDATVIYFGQTMRVGCDRQCNKAWGIVSRPTIALSDDPDDFAYLADGELGEAPADPSTGEGSVHKPLSPDEFPQKWCVRQCERCAKSAPGKTHELLTLTNWSKRVYNLPQEMV